MKKSKKWMLGGIGLLVIALLYVAFLIYQITAGSEGLSGKKEEIPSQKGALPPIIKGDSDWLNWRGPGYEGKSQFTGLKTDWKNGLKILWQVNYLCQDQNTASWSSPVVQGNRLIVPGRDEKNDLVFCINSDNGNLIWAVKYESEAGTSHGPGARATPAIDGDRVYTFGRSGDLVCWQLLDGRMLWRKNIKEEGGEEPQWGCSSSPLVLDNKVIVQGGGKALVIAYDKNTGSVLWKSMNGKGGYAAPVTLSADNKAKLIIYHGTGISCLNSTDGQSLWTAKWETDYGVNATTPIISKDIVFNTSGYKKGCQALRISEKGYSVLWENNAIEAQHTDPVLIGDYLYGYSGESSRNSGKFKCIELSTGREMWSTGKIGQGTITYVDGYLICLDIKGNLALVKPDPSGFQLTGEIKNAIGEVKSPAWTVPVIANGKLYLRYLQKLICFDISNNIN
jgi:outer membrane protein assembly factor BamB